MTAKVDIIVTSDEAFEYVKNPKGKTAKLLRRYLSELMLGICKKCIKTHNEQTEDV